MIAARALAATLAVAALLGACAHAPGSIDDPAPAAVACPKAIAEIARCLGGQDRAGAHYLIAVPQDWSGHLVLHAHGGPTQGPPKPERAVEDLTRWSIMVRAGHSWAGSTFREGGMAVRAAAEDTERLRHIFVAHVGAPKRTILHGQSWGAMIAARGADLYGSAKFGRPAYDGVLLTSGVLGGARSYDFRLDLRAVYQHVCGNHPRPGEPAYPLWAGLPEGARLTPAELRSRVDECLGLDRPASARTAEEVRKGKTIAEAVRIPESSIFGHLVRATWDFQEMARRYGDRPVMGNEGARYPGVPDEAIDRIGARFRADPAAAARFADDADPSGRLGAPTLTAHAVHDATAFVELENAFAERVARAGRADRLVQVFTDDREHSYITDPLYPALVDALLAWIEHGTRPTPADVQVRCVAHEAKFGKGCRVLPDFRPAALESRVAPRAAP